MSMSNARIPVHKIKELLRLKAAGLSCRQMAAATKLSLGAVSKYLKAADAAELAWPLPDTLNDEALMARLLGPPVVAVPRLAPPDFASLHQELKRKNVTLQLLWEEYATQQGSGAYSYSQFCKRYRDWAATLQRSMRQTHRAGEKLFLDYAGHTIPLVDALSG